MVPRWVTDIPLPKSPCLLSQDVSVLLHDGLTAFLVLLSPRIIKVVWARFLPAIISRPTVGHMKPTSMFFPFLLLSYPIFLLPPPFLAPSLDLHLSNQLPLRCCMISWCRLVFSQPDSSWSHMGIGALNWEKCLF